MSQVPTLGCGGEGIKETVKRGAKPPPGFNGTRCDAPAFGGRVPEVLIMFPVDSCRPRNNGGKSRTVGGHGMPYRGVKKEFCGIEGMGGNDVKDSLLHLVVFFGAQSRGSLISTGGISVPCKFGYEDLEPSVIPCLSAEKGKQMGNGLVDTVYASPLLTHEEVVRIPHKVSVTDRDDAPIIAGSSREVLTFATPAGDINAQPVQAGEGEIKVQEPKVLVSWGIGEASSIARTTGREKPGLFPCATRCFIQPGTPGNLDCLNCLFLIHL